MSSLHSLIRILAPLLLVVHIDRPADGTRSLPQPVAELQSMRVHQSDWLDARDAEFLVSVWELQERQTTEARVALRNSSDPQIQRFAEIIIQDDAVMRHAMTKENITMAESNAQSAAFEQQEEHLSGLEGVKLGQRFVRDIVETDQLLLDLCRREMVGGSRNELRTIAAVEEPQLQWQLVLAGEISK